jgi:pimeloyl-ACP methyl ester carboxylesterase
MCGSRDAAAVGTSHILREEIASTEFAVLPGVGHDPFFEAPDASLDIVRRFLR